MKLPRDMSGRELAKLLRRYGDVVSRQTGSHLRLTTAEAGEHHLTIPAHHPLKVGTIAGILASIAEHRGVAKLLIHQELFGP